MDLSIHLTYSTYPTYSMERKYIIQHEIVIGYLFYRIFFFELEQTYWQFRLFRNEPWNELNWNEMKW